MLFMFGIISTSYGHLILVHIDGRGIQTEKIQIFYSMIAIFSIGFDLFTHNIVFHNSHYNHNIVQYFFFNKYYELHVCV